MEKKPTTSSIDLRQKLDLFLNHWKKIVFCAAIALGIAFTYLRYATSQYSASATIKIQDEKQATKLPSIEESISGGGLFSDRTEKIKDEIEIIRSRTLIENVVKNLKLNIRCFEQGNIKEQELYKNPAVKLSFFASDSVINKVDTTLYMKIKSQSEFILFKEGVSSFMERDVSEGKVYAFGDRIKTGFGDMVITPNTGKYSPKIGSDLRISISSVRNLVNGYQKSIAIGTDVGSSVIKLELQQSNAQKAVDILNELITQYNNDVLADKEQVVEVTSNFIDNRLQVVSQELEQVEQTAEQLQKNNRLTALSSQANIYLESEKINESQILDTSNKLQLIDFLQEEVNAEDKASDLLPMNVINDPSISQVTKSYNDLVAERDRILKNSTEKNPIVIKLNDEIRAQKANLQNTLSKMKESSQITLNTLNKEDARIRGQLYSAPKRERQFRGIERQQDIKESLYLYLLEKREESTIRLGMYAPVAKIIDSAYTSNMPVAPNHKFTYLAALMLGLAIPMGLIYASDLLNTKFYRKEDLVEILDIPYLGDVPKTDKKQKLVQKVDYSPKAEAFRIIRSNIDFMLKGVDNRAKKIFVTSTRAQEGKSHTSTNLSTSISFSSKSVLLIETDIRVPKIMEYLGFEDKPRKGLSDYIADKSIKPQDVVVKHDDNAFIDIIPSGTIPPNPSELLMSDRIDELFKYFETKYDYIVVDTSAVGLVSDTLLIADHADLFVYVVSADNIDKRHVLHIAKPLYEKNRLPQMTMLLNGTKLGAKGYGYGYGYGNDPDQNKKWYNFFSKKKN